MVSSASKDTASPVENTAGAFTPGPWRSCPTGATMREKYSQPHGVYELDGHNLIAGCFGDTPRGEEAAEANARLISSAPDLYEALKGMLYVDSANEGAKTIARVKAKAAIAKAEGR